MASPSRQSIRRHLYETAHELLAKINGSSPTSRCSPMLLNHRFEPNEPWRLQERPDAELTGREEPEYGRRYEIFYNEYSVGNLQIFASHHYGPADPQVGTEIELQYARLLPFGEINRFISAIANFTASGNAEEAQRVKNTIHETMLNELWQHEFDPDLHRRNNGGSIELRF